MGSIPLELVLEKSLEPPVVKSTNTANVASVSVDDHKNPEMAKAPLLLYIFNKSSTVGKTQSE